MSTRLKKSQLNSDEGDPKSGENMMVSGKRLRESSPPPPSPPSPELKLFSPSASTSPTSSPREVPYKESEDKDLSKGESVTKADTYEEDIRAKSVEPIGRLGQITAIDSRERLTSQAAIPRDFTSTNSRIKVPWNDDEVAALVSGIDKFGCRWRKILVDKEFAERLRLRNNVDLKDKYRNLIKTGAYKLEVATVEREQAERPKKRRSGGK